MMRPNVLILLVLGMFVANGASAEDPPAASAIRAAAERGLAIVEKAATNYPKQRDCFACHHQTLPMLAIVTAAERGWKADLQVVAEQAEFTRESFTSRLDSLKAGKDIGGRSMTVGYGALALALAGHENDELSSAMVTFLLKNQAKNGVWKTGTGRPPMEESQIACTALALHALGRFASVDQKPEIEKARERALAWLKTADAPSQEDKAARLWLLSEFQAGDAAISAARKAVLDAQNADGGWSQTAAMAGDAYATGQTLYILARTGTPDIPATEKAVRFLLKTQCEDGSWFVETRSKPVQVFFDNGDPHGKSQFISIPATCWAVAGLAAYTSR